MSTLMLDTSAYSAFMRGQKNALTAVRSAERILLPSIVIGELFAGFELGNRRQQNHDEFSAFLASPRIVIANVTQDTAFRYAHIHAYLRRAGTPIPTNDLWIAALAMEHSVELLTADGHFQRVPHILVKSLAVG